MRSGVRLALLILGISLLPACLMSISINNDGTYCSEVATCPSGMECSPDGYCLFPCPEAGCTGDRCGCEYRDDLSAPRVCGDDGYCHVACRAEPTFCNDNRSCDAETGHCVLPCAITADCANGAVCVPTQDPEGYAFSVCRAP